jgi:hypothetical protein
VVRAEEQSDHFFPSAENHMEDIRSFDLIGELHLRKSDEEEPM